MCSYMNNIIILRIVVIRHEYYIRIIVIIFGMNCSAVTYTMRRADDTITLNEENRILSGNVLKVQSNYEMKISILIYNNENIRKKMFGRYINEETVYKVEHFNYLGSIIKK